MFWHGALWLFYACPWSWFGVWSHRQKANAKLTLVTCPSFFFPKLTSRTPSCLLTEHLPTRLWQRSWMYSMNLWTTPKANLQRQCAVSSEAAQRCWPTGTIDCCWKACKNMLPSSLSSQSPMIMTYVKAWQWRCIHRNADVCDITAKTVRKLMWWKRVAGAVATCGVGQMFISWWCL